MATMCEQSSTDYTACVSVEQINSGSLQRIAIAVEKMASSYDSMRADRDCYRRWYKEELAKKEVLQHRIAGLRGVINRMKKR